MLRPGARARAHGASSIAALQRVSLQGLARRRRHAQAPGHGGALSGLGAGSQRLQGAAAAAARHKLARSRVEQLPRRRLGQRQQRRGLERRRRAPGACDARPRARQGLLQQLSAAREPRRSARTQPVPCRPVLWGATQRTCVLANNTRL